MSDLLCLGTIALAGLTQATLQLSFGGLILLYHSSMGRHRRQRTRRITTAYMLGVTVISFLCVGAFAYLILKYLGGALSTEMLVICVGVFLATALVMWLLYFRKGKNTELWLPRSFTRFIARRARETSDRIEAFSLGLLSAFAEMPMSVAIFFVVANSIQKLSASLQVPAVCGYILIVCLPMIALKFTIKNGESALEIQKLRIRNKAFAKIISGGFYAILALFIVAFWVM